MKKLSLLVVALSCSALSTFAQKWVADPVHSKLGFEVSHMLVSDVDGTFKKYEVKMISSNTDFTDAVIELTADINSIDTDNDGRDEHLKKEDFFSATQYPTLTFKSTAFKKTSDKNYVLTGMLTMRGVTKPVSLNVVYNGTILNPHSKKTIAGFKVSGTIKRKEFAVGKDTPSAMVGDDVTIQANLEMVKD